MVGGDFLSQPRPCIGCSTWECVSEFQEAVSSFKPELKRFLGFAKISPSSLFMLHGCISSSVAYLMSWSMYPDFAERMCPVV
jgi:hypothetical protein